MASNPQHEPTMEEILASIRKIISEDSTDAAAEQPKTAPAPVQAAPAPVAQADADVLELTQEVVEEAPPPRPAPPPEPAPVRVAQMAPPPSPAPVRAENDVVFEAIEEPQASSAHDGIFSERTRRAFDETFAKIEPDHEESSRMSSPPMPGIDARTVEAVFERAVRESFVPVMTDYLRGNADALVERMKPLIRDWMDEHFPALLEGAVRAEVERVVRARGRK